MMKSNRKEMELKIMIITDKNFSDIIQSFIINEIKIIINKYNQMESDIIEKFILQIDDEEFKKELLSDFNKTLQLAIEIGDKYVDNTIIKLYMWMKSNTDLDLNIDAVENLIQDVEENGYCEINDNTMI